MSMINAYVKFKTFATDGTEARLILRNVTYPEKHRGFNAIVRDGTAEFDIDRLAPGAEYVWTLVSCADSGAVQFEEHGKISVFCRHGSGAAEGGSGDFGGAAITGDLTSCQVLKFAVR
jgi:hypothetical protein